MASTFTVSQTNLKTECDSHKERTEMAYDSMEATNARTANTLTGQIEDFSPVINRLEGYLEKLRIVTDRINGSHPRAAPFAENIGGKDQSVASNLMSMARHQRDRLVRVADAYERELNSLEQLL